MQIIDWVLIGLYMIFMVAIGAYFKTSSSMSDYAVADKKLGLSVLVATFLATGVGGGVLTGSTGNGFASGIVEIPKLAVLFCINILWHSFWQRRCETSAASLLLKCWAVFMDGTVRLWVACSVPFIRWAVVPPCSPSLWAPACICYSASI